MSERDSKRRRYRLMHPNAKQRKSRCRQCGAPVKEGRLYYCSATCQAAYNWHRNPVRLARYPMADQPAPRKRCATCGRLFICARGGKGSTQRQQQYCSAECRNRYWNERTGRRRRTEGLPPEWIPISDIKHELDGEIWRSRNNA